MNDNLTWYVDLVSFLVVRLPDEDISCELTKLAYLLSDETDTHVRIGKALNARFQILDKLNFHYTYLVNHPLLKGTQLLAYTDPTELLFQVLLLGEKARAKASCKEECPALLTVQEFFKYLHSELAP